MIPLSSDRAPEPCPESSNTVGKRLEKVQHDKRTTRLQTMIEDDGGGEKDVFIEEDLLGGR